MTDFLWYLSSIDPDIILGAEAFYAMAIFWVMIISFGSYFKSFSEKMISFIRSFLIFNAIVFFLAWIAAYTSYSSFKYEHSKIETDTIKSCLKKNDYNALHTFITTEHFFDNGIDDGEMTELCKKNKYHQRLIKNAVPYYLKKNKPDSAMYYLNTYEFQFKPGKPTRSWFHKDEERESYNQEAEFYNIQVFKIANYLKEHGKIKVAKNFLVENIKQYTDEDNNITLKPVEVKFNYFMKD